jgi:hypothetical protein
MGDTAYVVQVVVRGDDVANIIWGPSQLGQGVQDPPAVSLPAGIDDGYLVLQQQQSAGPGQGEMIYLGDNFGEPPDALAVFRSIYPHTPLSGYQHPVWGNKVPLDGCGDGLFQLMDPDGRKENGQVRRLQDEIC